MHQAELSDELFEKFRRMIYRTTGIRMPETKRVLISNRVRKRLRATGISSFDEYYETLLLAGDRGDERANFIDAITTQETYFFRDRHQFDWLGESFLNELADQVNRRKRPRRLSIWSAACSTGEEVYSILIRLADRHRLLTHWKVSVLGTDISGAALEKARAASYDARSMRLVGPEDRDRFFDHEPATGRWIVRPELRKQARFQVHNLLEPMRAGPFDCVIIKNVLIYFDAESKRKVIRNVIDPLVPGGYLVVGPTEGVYSLLGGMIKREHWLYQRPAEGEGDG